MNFLKALAGSAIVAGLLISAGGCELIVAPDRTKIGEGGGGDGGTGGTGGTTSACTPVDDSNDCTEDVCENDQPVSNPLAAGTTCSAGVCDGAGVCIGCIDDMDCTAPMVCIDDACVDPTCRDTFKNGTETDVDCGGDCTPCADDLVCDIAADCQSGVCESMKCQPAACDDTVKNGDETDVDCGGACAPAKTCDDGDGCEVAGDCTSGVCTAMACAVPVCGDGVDNQATEACDDGNMVDGDGCDNDCSLSGCGNGTVAGTEVCDDGNETNGDGCDDGPGGNCTPSACGNGVIAGTEVCDDGNKANDDGCDDGTDGNCTPTGCGNGVLTGMEVCDDGNKANGDGCDDAMGANCTPTGCGNGVLTGTEVCDDGNTTLGDGCDDGPNGNCTASACGNGVTAGTETCDDGNTVNGDGCDSAAGANCSPTGCGNGVLTGTEACDDGNNVLGDGCDDGPTGNCTVTDCGNGVISAGEACDDGNNTNGDTCDDGPGGNCTIAGCGNGVIVAPEVCDDNNLINNDGCDANCTITACGNGITAGAEECDDGNVINGDGCDSATGTGCKTTACGNGIIAGAEVCDDSNAVGADGCSATCTPENLETEMNGTCGTEDGPFLVSGSVNVIAAITPLADLDFFSFTLPGPGPSSIKIETFSGIVPGACATGNDTLVELRGTNCTTVLATDDDDGLAACSLIDAAAAVGADVGARKLPAGTYFVRVNEFNNDATIANYNITVSILSTCGNGGALEPTEACDDGNLTSGDGCDVNCTITACGNGVIAGTEACDDGNTTAGDGCSATCTIEPGYACNGAPSVCLGVCNNGTIEANEACEDGNAADGDCCSSTCQVEACETEMNGTCSGTEDAMPPFALSPKVAYAGGAITPSGDVDFYSFTLTKPSSVRVESFTTKVGQCTADTLIELRASDCTTTVISDDDDGVNNCSLIDPTTAGDSAARNLPPGTYFVRVAAFSGTIASYGVKVTLVDECGNGTKGAFEACDDGNNTAGDGCTATCTVQPGFGCVGTTPSVCTDNDECTLNTDNCSANATCTNTPGSFTCMCNSGFTGDGVTCTDNDECTLNTDNCDTNATCANTPGSFTCTCNAGFGGNGVTCTDNDECTLNTDNCSPNATCTNNIGSFSCMCNAGFTGDGVTCTDNDECTLNTDNCDANATCANTPGSFTCTCNTGYSGSGVTCADVDECTLNTDNCDTNATCTNNTGSFSCACNSGYLGNGVICDLPISCLELNIDQPALGNGDYMIDPDGAGAIAAFTVRCDMTTDSGGWTLVFNDSTTFNPALDGSGASTGFTTNFINLAYSTVDIVSDVIIDARDGDMNGLNQQARSVILGLPVASTSKTMKELLTTGTTQSFFDAENNANVTNTFDAAFATDCAALLAGTDWDDYGAAICGNDVLVGNDQTNAVTFGKDTSYSVSSVNAAGWPQAPNFGGTNFWPDNFRVWVR